MIARVHDAQQWAQFVDKCFEVRLAPQRFESIVAQTNGPSTNGKAAAALVIKRSPHAGSNPDPLLLQYLQGLLSSGYVQGHDVLQVLLDWRNEGDTPQDVGENVKLEHDGTSQRASRELQDAIMRLVGTFHIAQDNATPVEEKREMLMVIMHWIVALAKSNVHGHEDVPSTYYAVENSLRATVSVMFVDLCQIEGAKQLLDNLPQGIEKTLPEAISRLAAEVSALSSQLASQLADVQHSHHSLRPTGGPSGEDSHELNLDELHLDSVPERMPTRARVSLTIFLEALLYGTPELCGDTILKILLARSRGDVEHLVIELILSSFDLLAITSDRSDGSGDHIMLSSFIVNKIPLLINQLTSLLYTSGNTSYIVLEAMHSINTRISATHDDMSVATSDSNHAMVVSHFVTACVLHGVLDQAQAQNILPDDQLEGLLQRNSLDVRRLIEDIRRDEENLTKTIEELNLLDGNSSYRAEALANVMKGYCHAEDTLAMKQLCRILLTQENVLDMLFLFNEARTIVEPLCGLIDRWSFDHASVDGHATYEEFSVCFTTLLAMIHRFGIPVYQLPLKEGQSFIRWFICAAGDSSPAGKPPERLQQCLSDWLQALFEKEGIEDQLLSRYPPHDFYRIVPSIYSQVLTAHDRGTLSKQKLMTGFELLQQTILVPCLAIGLPLLTNIARTRTGNIDAAVYGIQGSMRSVSADVVNKRLHGILIATTGDTISRFVTYCERKHPDRQDVKAFPAYEVQAFASRAATRLSLGDVQRYNETASTGLLPRFANSFDALCAGSANSSQSAITAYSHPASLLTVQLCGSVRVIRLLVDQVTLQLSSAHPEVGDVALDVAASLVCAFELGKNPGPSNALSLKQALQMERNHAAEAMTHDPARAETIVHLHRAVDAQLSHQLPVDLQLSGQGVMEQEVSDVMQAVNNGGQMLGFSGQESNFPTNMSIPFEGLTMFPQNTMHTDSQQDSTEIDITHEPDSTMEHEHNAFDYHQLGQQGVAAFAPPLGHNSLFVQDNNAVNSNFFTIDEQPTTSQSQLPTLQQGSNNANDTTMMNDDDFWASLGVNNDY